MWHTSAGDRVLEGSEARIFKAALTRVVEDIKEEAFEPDLFDQWEYGIPRFDELTWSQRLQVLEQIASHLLMPSDEAPELNAINESAIAVVYERMRHEIDFEIDSEQDEPTEWREMVLAVYRERFGEEESDLDEEDRFTLPELASTKREEWSDLIGSLEDEILWDQDFLMEEFLDAPPEKSDMLKQYMGIDADYYSAVAPDPTDSVVAELVTRLESLTK